MNITITGNLGSGKSTVCAKLKQTGFTVISGGDIFRQVAKEQHLSVVELNEKVQEEIKRGEHQTDDMIDAKSARLGEELDHAIFDFRLGWHFVKDSFKVFLLTDIDEAARRVFTADRETEKYGDIKECKDSLLKRQRLEQERFADLYQINYYDMSNYNLIIDTTHASPEQVSQKILSEFSDYQEGKFARHILLNPLSLCRLQDSAELAASSVNDDAVALAAEAEPVRVAEKDGKWHVLEGYSQILTALSNRCGFVSVHLENSPEFELQKEL